MSWFDDIHFDKKTSFEEVEKDIIFRKSFDENNLTQHLKEEHLELYKGYANKEVRLDDFFPKILASEEYIRNVEPGAAYLKYKIFEAFPKKPLQNTKESKILYALVAHQTYLIFHASQKVNDMLVLRYWIDFKGENTEKQFKSVFGVKLFNLFKSLSNSIDTRTEAKTIVFNAYKYSGISKELAEEFAKDLKEKFNEDNEKYNECYDEAYKIKNMAGVNSHKSYYSNILNDELKAINTVRKYKQAAIDYLENLIDSTDDEYHKKINKFPYKKTSPSWKWVEKLVPKNDKDHAIARIKARKILMEQHKKGLGTHPKIKTIL